MALYKQGYSDSGLAHAGMLAVLVLLAVLSFTSCVCLSNSSVILYNDTSHGLRVSQCLTSCDYSLDICPGKVRACCKSGSCFSGLLGSNYTCTGSDFSIQVNGGTEVILSRTHLFFELSSVVIEAVGGGVATITCENASVVFDEVDSVIVRNVQWVNCGGVILDIFDGFELSGALMLTGCRQAYMANTTFTRSSGTGLVLTARIIKPSDNEDHDYAFDNVTFIDGGLESPHPHTGGGVSVQLLLNQSLFGLSAKGSETSIAMQFTNCSFLHNQATVGGGVYVQAFTTEQNMQMHKFDLHFKDCTFNNNSALTAGGAVTVFGSGLDDFNITFGNCQFQGNSAYFSGGAVHVHIAHNSNKESMHIFFSDCLWDSNKAVESSALSIKMLKSKFFTDVVTIVNSKMEGNDAQVGNSDAKCTALFQGIDKAVLQDVVVTKNLGSGLCLRRSNVVIIGSVTFSLNYRANHGGGIFLQRQSSISLEEGAHLTFESNAAVFGGGMFVMDASSTRVCVFTSTTPYVNASFANNQAYFDGGTAYFEQPVDSCKTEIENVHYIDLYYASVNSAIVNGSEFLTSNNTLASFPGQQIVLNVNMKDFFGNSGKANVRVYLHPHTSEYHLTGLAQFTLQDGRNQPNLTIVGPDPAGSNASHFLEIASLDQYSASINQFLFINITPCSLGFVYNTTQQRCVCSDGVVCDNYTGTACIPKGYWFGNFPNDNSSLVILPCSSGYCSNIGNCEPCAAQEDHCQLLESQCIQSRTGPLCLQCPEGYSYTFGALQCTSNECYASVTLIVIIIYCLISFGLLFLMMKFTNGTTLGALFCFVYYYSVVDFIIPLSIEYRPLLSIIFILQSFTQLSPTFLGLLPLCILPNTSILAQQYLLYVSPLLVWVIVVTLIMCSRKCPRFVKFNDRTPITVISLLLLLTFTAVSKTSFNIVLPVFFDDVDGVFINIAANTYYTDNWDHQLFFAIAAILLLFGVFPFMLFLFAAPCLSRYCNVTRIKPFLDEFQACYKDDYRWMAGFYFLSRIAYFLSQLYMLAVIKEYSTQLLSLGVLLFHVMLQPYKKKWLNFADTILLTDLLTISMLYGKTGQDIFSEGTKSIVTLRDALSSILILVPILYILLQVSIGFYYKYPKVAKKVRSFWKWGKEKRVIKQHISNLYIPYREPLLSVADLYRRPDPTAVELDIIPSSSDNVVSSDVTVPNNETTVLNGSSTPKDIPLTLSPTHTVACVTCNEDDKENNKEEFYKSES